MYLMGTFNKKEQSARCQLMPASYILKMCLRQVITHSSSSQIKERVSFLLFATRYLASICIWHRMSDCKADLRGVSVTEALCLNIDAFLRKYLFFGLRGVLPFVLPCVFYLFDDTVPYCNAAKALGMSTEGLGSIRTMRKVKKNR